MKAQRFNNLGFKADYNYEQHMRPMGMTGGHFVPAPSSVASAARSKASAVTRRSGRTAASARSMRGEIVLRSEGQDDAFGADEDEELEVGVGGGFDAETAAVAEQMEAETKNFLDEDMWDLLKPHWEGEAAEAAKAAEAAEAAKVAEAAAAAEAAEAAAAAAAAEEVDPHAEYYEERWDDEDETVLIDDDFVVQANRDRTDNEMLRDTASKARDGKKGKYLSKSAGAAVAAALNGAAAAAAAAAVAEDEETGGASSSSLVARAEAAGKKKNPFAELFGGLDDDDDEEEEESEEEEVYMPGRPAGKGGKGQPVAPVVREERLLDAQFARLMAEYGDEDIGELDEFDPAVMGHASIDVYDKVMDDFLSSSVIGRMDPALAYKRAPDDFGPITRERIDGGVAHERWDKATGDSRGLVEQKEAAARGGREGEAGAAVDMEAAAGEEEEDNGDDAGKELHPHAAETDVPLDDHPFFQEPPAKEQWDVETIISTYSTTDNIPTKIGVPRKPKSVIALDSRSGLPVGISIPGTKPRLPATREEGGDGSSEGDDDEGEEGEEGERANLGVARPREEDKADKRARKAATKQQKQERKRDKKQTKLAFNAEKGKQLETHKRTAQQPAVPL